MADKRDYYEVLGVDKNADDAAIKKAYRSLAKQYHPDAHPDDAEAEAKFKEASEAYAVLSDKDKRAKYDQFGHAAFEGGAGGAGGFDFNSFDFGDIFGDLFGGGFGGFGGFGGRGRGRSANAPMQGANVGGQVRISFDDVITGVKKTVQINYKEECEKCHGTGAKEGTTPASCGKCNGTGQVITTQQTMFGMMRSQGICPDCGGKGKIIKDKCSHCHGTGYNTIRKTIDVEIPAGIENGQSIRVRGQGEPGENGGPRGDLIVGVVVQSSPLFHREGFDVFSVREISVAQAALGDTIRIKTVDGEVEYDLKPGTQPETRIRLRGKGIPYLRDKNQRGDHYVTFVVKIPEKLNSSQKSAMKAFDEAMGGTLSSSDKKKK